MSKLNELLEKRNLFLNSEKLWEIQMSDLGLGLHALRKIEKGETIFKDYPIIVGPQSVQNQIVGCAVCFNIKSPLRSCSKNCHLPICSSECESSSKHEKECEFFKKFKTNEENWSLDLYLALSPLRCLFVNDDDRKIINYLHSNSKESTKKQVDQIKKLGFLSDEDMEWIEHCCGVLNGNAFEVELFKEFPFCVRGLYPLTGLLNHNCSPNTRRYHEKGSFSMAVVATKDIEKGEEITHHYCSLFWATNTRRMFLRITKEFLCKCLRCQDPTVCIFSRNLYYFQKEFESYVSAMICKCGGIVLPLLPLKFTSDWQCQRCTKKFTSSQITKGMTESELELSLHKNNGLSLERKKETVYKLNKQIKNLKDEELNEKERLEKEVLETNDKLKLGDSRSKGIFCYLLYKTLAEKKNRKIPYDDKELEENFKKAKEILENDRTAPTIDVEMV